jgi:hypothetical protein
MMRSGYDIDAYRVFPFGRQASYLIDPHVARKKDALSATFQPKYPTRCVWTATVTCIDIIDHRRVKSSQLKVSSGIF